ncbi:MAG: HemK family protein methyltransferase, partial [Bacteroidetes bacterium]
KHVLIPRPETEEVVDWITKTLKADEALEMLDVGTGSGCIGISLALHFANAGVTALDVSSDALTVARKNALALGAANIGFLKLDFSQPSARKQLPPCDVLVSNPPYIPWAEKPGMEKLVTDWEPEVALFVPHQNPLFFYE